jgi:peptidoglycan/LPS O-acetylase OafA/YrhL
MGLGPAAAVGETRAPSSTTEPTSAPVPRLRHVPALDGLRGVAVLVVVAFHLDRLSGGFLGVDLFFVLSGYLITSLLLVEHAGSGAVRLGRFWARRARRLLPALLLMLVCVTVLVGTLTPAGERPLLRGDALATLGYAANWQAMADDVGYWDIFVQPSPLDHMWSLAIEEQFYVVWPLLAAGLLARAARRRRRGSTLVAVVAGAGAVASFAVMAATYSELDTSRAYYGTDARLGPTLLGVALAALTAASERRSLPDGAAAGTLRTRVRESDRAARLARRAAAVVAVVAAAACLVAIDGRGAAYYRGGLVVFALASITLVHLAVTDGHGVLGRALAARPFVALGVVSYGVYLWHWPVIVYATPERTGLDGVALDAARIAATLALALVSFRLVEQPVRRGWPRGWRAPTALAGAAGVVAVAVLVVTGGAARVPGTEVALGDVSAATDASGSLYPPSVSPGAPHILLVGDSGPFYLGPALLAEAEEQGAEAASESDAFCSVVEPEGVTRWPDGNVIANEPCHDERHERWAAAVERFDPDVVVYYLASVGGLADARYQGRWVHECDADYDRWMTEELGRDVDILGARGATVVLATTPRPPFVSHVGAEAEESFACRRATYDTIAAARPGMHVVDMAGTVREAQDRHEESMFRDIVHLSDVGAAEVAAWLVPTVLAFARPTASA